MSGTWEGQFRHRMTQFARRLPSEADETAVSIKVRVTSGCFHREHSPEAYKMIDECLMQMPEDAGFAFEEHESGPEILVYLALGTAGLTIAKSVLDLITAIIKARSEGIKHGDSPHYPIELVVRGFDDDGQIREEHVMRFNPDYPVSRDLIERMLLQKLPKPQPTGKPKKR